MTDVSPIELLAGVVIAVPTVVLVYGATIGDEGALSLVVGVLVLAGWIAGLVSYRLDWGE